MSEAAMVTCGYAEQHPRIDSELRDLDRRLLALEREGREDRKDLWAAVGRVEKSSSDVAAAVANIKGWLAGSMIAASLLGAVVAFIAMRALK